MNRFTKAFTVGVFLIAGLGSAGAQDATNPAVIARQALMRIQGQNSKILGDMASGKTQFDATAAAAAKAALIETSVNIPVVFEPNEDDPASEAKPEIWTNWADFMAKGEALHVAVQALDTTSADTLKAGMAGVGAGCGGCHRVYRE